MRIVIGCAALCLGRGGTERAAVNLAQEMTKRGHKVLIISLTAASDLIQPSYSLSPDIRHMSWMFDGKHENIQYLKKFLIADKTDVFISMQSDHMHLFWAMVCMGSGIPFIYSERTDPVRIMETLWNRYGRMAVLSGADYIHELLPIHAANIPAIWINKTIVIPNAAPIFKTFASPRGEERKRKQILYLARFSDPKRPLLLMRAFHLLLEKYPEWDLLMHGHGPEEKKLKNYARQLNMSERVLFPGQCVNIEQAYANSHIYCLPSYLEGFPNTVLEAMTSGLPVVGFSECPAVSDILRQGKTGVLVDNSTPEDLAANLSKLMCNPGLRASMGKSAKKASDKYAPERVYDQWEELFKELTRRKGNTVMDSFYNEPFASMARLSSVARREYLYRDFGQPMPYTFSWLKQKNALFLKRLFFEAKQHCNRLIGRHD